MNKKAQGISLNVVVIAAIALLVLIVLAVIFLGKMAETGEGLKDCEAKGGKCVSGVSCANEPNGYTTSYSYSKCGTGKSCCINVG